MNDGSLEDRLIAESAGPANVDAWDRDGGLAEDVSAVGGGARKITSLHVGSGLLASIEQGAKTDRDGGDFDGGK
jgi:hypothetical protein